MPDGRSPLCDVGALTNAGSELQFDLPIERMERVSAALAAPTGWVRGHARFAREQGRPVARLQFTAQLQLRCQRCLEAMPARIEGGSLVYLVESEAAARGLPEDAETILAPEGRFALSDLVEEDLLLSLPLVPRHAAECGARDVAGQELPEQPAQRPFAGLEELMRSDERRGRGD